jgi:predicted nucleic acid-binding protein
MNSRRSAIRLSAPTVPKTAGVTPGAMRSQRARRSASSWIFRSLPSLLGQLAAQVRTVPVTPAIALAAATLPSTFPGDPADRLIYATALGTGLRLITKDERLRGYRAPRAVTIW